MSAHPRIVLFPWLSKVTDPGASVSDKIVQHPTSAPWRQRNYAAARMARGSGLVGWRALGANNRELGRAAQPAIGLEAAIEAVHAVQADLAQAVTRTVREAGVGWSWRILVDGEWVVTSSRRYQRQRECAYSLEQFLEWFPVAAVVLPPPRLLLVSDEPMSARVLDLTRLEPSPKPATTTPEVAK